MFYLTIFFFFKRRFGIGRIDANVVSEEQKKEKRKAKRKRKKKMNSDNKHKKPKADNNAGGMKRKFGDNSSSHNSNNNKKFKPSADKPAGGVDKGQWKPKKKGFDKGGGGDKKFDKKKKPFPGKDKNVNYNNDNKGGEKKRPKFLSEKQQVLLKCKQLLASANVASRSEDSPKVIAEVVSLGTGHFLEFARRSDGARLIQTLLKYSTPDVHEVIIKELKGNFAKLITTPYGRHIVLRILASCKNYRKDIYHEFRGHVNDLLKNKDAALVLEEAFLEYTTSVDRHSLLQEFYGPEFAIFHTEENLTLKDIFEKKPEKKKIIMNNMRQSISALLNKDVCTLNIVHHIIDEYLQHATQEEILDVISEGKERIAEFVHTTKGSKIVMRFFEHSTAKERKVMLKAIKDFAVQACKDSHGYLVVIRIFESVDDTIMVKKTIVTALLSNMEELICHKFGRRPFLYLLVGRHPKYFVVGKSLFEENDHIREMTSKKDLDTKRNELLEEVSPHLLNLVQQKPGELLRDQFSCEVVAEVLRHAKGDRAPVMKAVADLVKEEAEGTDHVMTHIVANRILKRLIHEESGRKEKGEEKVADSAVKEIPNPSFTLILADALKGKMFQWANNWGAVVLTALLESYITSKLVMNELFPKLDEITEDIPASKLLRNVLISMKNGGASSAKFLAKNAAADVDTKDGKEKKKDKKKKEMEEREEEDENEEDEEEETKPVEKSPAKTPARTPAKETKTPIKTPAAETKTPAKTSMKDTKTPAKEKNDSKTPAKTPAKDIKTPAKRNDDDDVSKTPAKENANVKTPAKVVETPAKDNVKTPAAKDKSKTPANVEIKIPAKVETKTPAKNVKTPAKEPKTPAKAEEKEEEVDDPMEIDEITPARYAPPKTPKTEKKAEAEDEEGEQGASKIKTPSRKRSTADKTPATTATGKRTRRSAAAADPDPEEPESESELDAVRSLRPRKAPANPSQTVDETPAKATKSNNDLKAKTTTQARPRTKKAAELSEIPSPVTTRSRAAAKSAAKQ